MIQKILRDIFFQAACVSCGQLRADETLVAGVICAQCYAKLVRQQGALCQCCGQELVSEIGFCQRCREEAPVYDRCRSVFRYDERFQKLLIAFKGHGNRDFVREWVGDLLELLDDCPQQAPIVPIPCRNETRHRTGWDPVLGLAVALGRECRRPVLQVLRLAHQRAQKTLDRQNRLQGKDNRFCPCLQTVPECVVILDDVVTTGSTLQAAAAELRKAGAKRVEAISLARR